MLKETDLKQINRTITLLTVLKVEMEDYDYLHDMIRNETCITLEDLRSHIKALTRIYIKGMNQLDQEKEKRINKGGE